MATSGSVDFTRTRGQIVNGAMRLIGVLSTGETPSSEDTEAVSEALNMMVKAWQARGINLWTLTEATLFPAADTVKYSLGPTGWHATESFTETTLSADAAAGAATITVTSITGISNADYLGIELDDATIQWTTVNGAPSGSTVTPTAVLTGAASSGNAVYAYTTKIDRPLRIQNVRRYVNGVETALETLSRQEYFDLPDKTTESTVTAYFFDPQLTNSVIYLWPEPSDPTEYIKFSYQRPIEDFDATANTPDFPQEWLEALKYNLAIRIAPEFGVPVSAEVRMMAEESLGIAESWDAEDASVNFGVAYDY